MALSYSYGSRTSTRQKDPCASQLPFSFITEIAGNRQLFLRASSAWVPGKLFRNRSAHGYPVLAADRTSRNLADLKLRECTFIASKLTKRPVKDLQYRGCFSRLNGLKAAPMIPGNTPISPPSAQLAPCWRRRLGNMQRSKDAPKCGANRCLTIALRLNRNVWFLVTLGRLRSKDKAGRKIVGAVSDQS